MQNIKYFSSIGQDIFRELKYKTGRTYQVPSRGSIDDNLDYDN